uniref:Uncharacterized protein n=1 Tax=Chromera velia CCMP2878 TaxID=1169474 RepID=A0A0G4GVA6_9ALVE|eukprot:Cvel_23527.t1-p1 / transcript=Cvel_23527.t1 / gene=Cvel_23527 / organism=Chromera_velia_CCMP2878 / gene_product=hypothetical protein / transcript_product=hypothetical protein / location=Cvel_scaffold2434:20979-28488(+) / protein_length=1158 / sequence_SO=supercontig / SO=protein_coding / is_pseudo=false
MLVEKWIGAWEPKTGQTGPHENWVGNIFGDGSYVLSYVLKGKEYVLEGLWKASQSKIVLEGTRKEFGSKTREYWPDIKVSWTAWQSKYRRQGTASPEGTKGGQRSRSPSPSPQTVAWIRQDPEQRKDVLPQPFRQISKIVEALIDEVFQQIDVIENRRTVEEYEVGLPKAGPRLASVALSPSCVMGKPADAEGGSSLESKESTAAMQLESQETTTLNQSELEQPSSLSLPMKSTDTVGGPVMDSVPFTPLSSVCADAHESRLSSHPVEDLLFLGSEEGYLGVLRLSTGTVEHREWVFGVPPPVEDAEEEGEGDKDKKGKGGKSEKGDPPPSIPVAEQTADSVAQLSLCSTVSWMSNQYATAEQTSVRPFPVLAASGRRSSSVFLFSVDCDAASLSPFAHVLLSLPPDPAEAAAEAAAAEAAAGAKGGGAKKGGGKKGEEPPPEEMEGEKKPKPFSMPTFLPPSVTEIRTSGGRGSMWLTTQLSDLSVRVFLLPLPEPKQSTGGAVSLDTGMSGSSKDSKGGGKKDKDKGGGKKDKNKGGDEERTGTFASVPLIVTPAFVIPSPFPLPLPLSSVGLPNSSTQSPPPPSPFYSLWKDRYLNPASSFISKAVRPDLLNVEVGSLGGPWQSTAQSLGFSRLHNVLLVALTHTDSPDIYEYLLPSPDECADADTIASRVKYVDEAPPPGGDKKEKGKADKKEDSGKDAKKEEEEKVIEPLKQTLWSSVGFPEGPSTTVEPCSRTCHAATVSALSVSPTGCHYLVGLADGAVFIVDSLLRQRKAVKGHFAAVTAAAFSGDALAVTGGRDAHVHAYAVFSGQLLLRLLFSPPPSPDPVVFLAPQSLKKSGGRAQRVVFGVDSAGRMRVFDLQGGKRICSVERPDGLFLPTPHRPDRQKFTDPQPYIQRLREKIREKGLEKGEDKNPNTIFKEENFPSLAKKESIDFGRMTPFVSSWGLGCFLMEPAPAAAGGGGMGTLEEGTEDNERGPVPVLATYDNEAIRIEARASVTKKEPDSTGEDFKKQAIERASKYAPSSSPSSRGGRRQVRTERGAARSVSPSRPSFGGKDRDVGAMSRMSLSESPKRKMVSAFGKGQGPPSVEMTAAALKPILPLTAANLRSAVAGEGVSLPPVVEEDEVSAPLKWEWNRVRALKRMGDERGRRQVG